MQLRWLLFVLLMGTCTLCAASGITREDWGEVDGQPVYLYTLQANNGFTVKVTNYGCIITEILVPDASGDGVDVVLGHDNLEDYLDGHPYFGCVIGRYANRIAGGSFELDGERFQLTRNNGENHLHGGRQGFHKKVWASQVLTNQEGIDYLTLSTFSADGEEGYPGNLTATIEMVLQTNTTDDVSNLWVFYGATCDRTTIVNLTHHNYFNLNGADSGQPILNHRIQLPAENFLPVDEGLIPTGVASVEGTPFDFRSTTRLGDALEQVHPQFEIAGGIDHNFVLSQDKLNDAGIYYSPLTQIAMALATTEPGLQMYGGHGLRGRHIGKGGVAYEKYGGLVLETQKFPDSPNQNFDGMGASPVLERGEDYGHITVFAFGRVPSLEAFKELLDR